MTSLRNSSHEVTQLLPCETAKIGPPPLLLFRGVGTTAFCVPGYGGDPPHQGWSVRQEVPALHLSRLNRQLEVTEGKLCQCPKKPGSQTCLDMARVQQTLSELQFWAGVKCKHHMCLSPFVLSEQSPGFFSGCSPWPLLIAVSCSLLGWQVSLAKHALHAAMCAARRRGLS